MSDIVEKTRSFVRSSMLSYDASHTFDHVERVVATALLLADRERCDEEQKEIIQLAALMHDVQDYKYRRDVSAGSAAVLEFLSSCGYPEERTRRVIECIENVGFKDEIGKYYDPRAFSLESRILQDSDRLDALGAIGCARAFTFGGARDRMLYRPSDLALVPGSITSITADAYGKQHDLSRGEAPSTLRHFHDKLFSLVGLMKTDSGKRIAASRHQFMVAFVDQLHAECAGKR